MKLRLPHKFHAALLAALASVSFTTLSTGSTAYGAELTKVITMGEMVTEDTVHGATINSTWVASDGSAVYDFSGDNCIYGINDADLLAALTSAATSSSTYVTVAAWINPSSHGGSIFGYGGGGNGIKVIDDSGKLKFTTKSVKDFNASGSGIDTDQNTWQLVAVTFSKNASNNNLDVYYMLNGQYSTTPAGNAGGMNTANPATFGIGTGDSNSSRENFTGSIGGLTVFTSDGMVTADQVISQMGNIGHTAGSNLAWNGTAGDNVWNTENANWIQSGAETTYTAGASPFFGAGAKSKDVVLGTDINAGTVTVEAAYTFNTDSGSLNATSLNLALAGASLTLEGGSAEHKSTIGNITSEAGTAVSLTNANVEISGSQTFKSSLTIGQGATVTVTQGDSMKWSDITNTITLLEGGELAFGNKRWSVGSGTTLVMAGGTVTGVGDGNGALDYHQSGATIRAIENSTIAASVRLRTVNHTTYFDIAPDKTLTMSGTLRGAATLYKTGAGTLEFTSKIGSDFSGSIVVAEGTLNVSNGLDGGFRTVTVNEGATVDLKGKDSVDYRMRYTLAGGTLTNTGNNTSTNKVQNDQITLTRDSYVSGTKTFYVLGASHGATYLNLNGNTLHKTGSNTFGLISTTVNAGTLDIQGGTIDFNTSLGIKYGKVAADIILDGGNISGKIQYTADTTLTVKKGVSTGVVVDLNGHNLALNVADAQTLTMTGAITGTGSLGKAGAGTATLSGANNISLNRTIMVDGGTLNYNGSLSVAGGPANGFEVFEAAEGDFNGMDEYAGSGFRTGNATKYYLVKVADGASATGITTITGATRVTEGTPANSWVGTIDVAQGDTTYYVNKDLTYNNDVMGSASGFAIAKGTTLTSAGMNVATSAKVLHGAGSYAIAGGNNNFTQANGWGLGANVSLGTDWTGTVVVSGTSTKTALIDFANLVNGTSSTIEVKGLDGWTNDWNGDIDENIKLTNNGNTVAWSNGATSGTQGHEAKFHGTWSGNGTFERKGSSYMNYKYTGDISQWTGKFQVSAGTTQLTFAGAAHEVNAQVVRTGGTLNVVADTDVAFKAALTGINDFTVNAGNTVTFASAPGITNLKGAGTIALDPSKINSLGSNRSNWTGTVTLTGTANNLNFGNLSNGANSTLEMKGYSGWAGNNLWYGTMVQNIKLTNGTGGYAWKNVANTTSGPNFYATFTGKISGDGTFEVQPDQLNYKFTGDVSEWTGVYKYTDNAYTSSVVFAGNANVINAQILDAGTGTSKLRLVVDNNATFNNTVTADEFELQNNHSVTFNNTATFSGSMTATGGTVNLGEHGSLSLGGLTKSGNGTLTLHGFSHLGSTIAMQGGSLVFGDGNYQLDGLDATTTYTYTEYTEGGVGYGYRSSATSVQLVNTGTNVSADSGASFSIGELTGGVLRDNGSVQVTTAQDNTTYYLVDGTSVDYLEEVIASEMQLSSVCVLGGTGTIEISDNWNMTHLDVRDNATARVSSTGEYVELSLYDAATFGSGAHVEITSGTKLGLYHEGSAAAVIQHATGAGDIDLDVNATLGNGTTTAATGTLTIADGKTLTLGGGDSTKVNISSFTQVVLDGGTISYNADESTINGLTVKDGKSGTLHLEDMGSKALVLGGDTVVDGTLTAKNHWNSLLTISHLTGDGTLIQTNGDNAVQEMIFAINSLEGFTGAIELSHNINGDTTSISTGAVDVDFHALTMNIGSHTMNFALDANAAIGTLTLTAGTANFTGAGTLTVGGLDGTAPLNVASLVISGTEAAHSYNGTASIGTLTMNGGTQTIGGTVTPTNTWILNGGSLTLAGTYNLDSMDASSRVAGHTGGLIEGNGFEALTGIRVVQVNNEAQLTSNATFTYAGKSDYTMDAQGVVEVESSGTTYDTFYILNTEDGKMETLTYAREQAGEHVDEFVNIVMNGGTSLDANAGGTLTALTVSGGTAGATTLVTDSSETSANLAITTVTVGVGDNLTVEGKALTITSTVLNERAGMVVGDGAAVTLSGVDMGLNSTFTVTGTGRVKLTDGTSAKNLLLSATGDGTYELATNVNLGNGVTTTPTGTLVVDSDYTLTLSGNKGQETYLDSFGKIQLEGGTIASSASMGTLHNVSVTADSAINFNDFKDLSGGQHQSLTTFAGTTDIAQGATLTVHTAYKSNLKYEGLSGAGTLKFTTNGGNYGGATVAIDSLQGFSGNITLAPGDNNPVNITAAIGDAATSMGVITLANGGNITATGSSTLTVAGLDGTAGSLTVPNLTINVEGEDSHTYGGALTVSGQLTKTGSGTQSLGSFTPAAPIVVSGGTLNFTGHVEIQQLDYTEGPRYTYTDATLTAHDQANGLRYEESKRTVYTTTDGGQVTLGENGAFTLNGQTVNVEGGVYHSSTETADLTTLWVNTGTVNLADYASVTGLTTAKLADAGTLNLGTAETPGTIANLQYQEGSTTMHLAGTGTVNAITGDANLNLAEGAEISLGYNPNITSGHTFTTAGEGTLVISTLNVTGGTAHLGSNARLGRFELSQGGSNVSTLEISAGATVEVTGTVTHSDGGKGSFMVSNWPASNILNIEGTLIANSGISSRDGQADINVKDGGTLEMRAGLFKNTDRTQAININVKQGGKLIAAGHDGDYTSSSLHVNLEGGSTLAGYYADGVDAIAINQTLTASGALTVDAGGTGKTMTINTGLTGDAASIIKIGDGTLALAGTNTYAGGTTVNAGTLKASSLGSGDITVNAGTLELTGAIAADGNLTLTDGATLVLAGANALTMGGELSLSGNVTFVLDNILPSTQGDYVLATGTTASITEGADISVVWNTKPEYFEIGQTVHVVDGNKWVITLTSLGQDLIWNGGEAEWSSTGDHWHTDLQDNVPFATGNKAIFAASQDAATANVNGDINAEGVVVQSGATVTIQAAQGAEAASITAAEFEVSGNLATSVNITATEIVGRGADATWNIGANSTVTTDILTADAGATLTLSGEGTITAGTITGEGTIEFDSGIQPDVTTITVAEGKELAFSGAAEKTVSQSNLNLTGTLVLENGYQMTISDQFNPGTAGQTLNIRNNAGLTVSLGSAQNVLNLDAASTGDLHISTGTISYLSGLGDQTLHMGNGTMLIFGENAGEKDAPVFSNDIVMDGDMTIQVYGTNYHTLTTINGDITGTGKLTKSDGGNVDFNGTVNVGSLSVTDGCTANFNSNAQLASTGTLTVNGGSTANFNSTEDMTFQAISVAGNNTHVSFDGHVTVNGTGSGNDYVNVTGATGLTVEFNKGFAFNGKGGNYSYALLVGNGATATLGGTTDLTNYLIGPAAGSTLVVAENASLTAKGIYNSTGTATSNGTLTVNSNATVNVSGALYEVTVNTAGNITVGGATSATTALNVTGGTNTFNGAATIATLNANGGSAAFNGATTITNLAAGGTGAIVTGTGAITVSNATRDQGVRIAKGKDLTLTTANLTATTLYNLGTLTIGDGSTPTLVKATYFVNGNMQDRSVTTGFEIKSGATVAISGGDGGNTHETGLVLSEWENGSTATVAGNLLARNATLLGGNTDGFTLNINNGGVVAVKGIKSNGNRTHAVNLDDGGKLVFGGTTSANNGGTLNAAAGGTIGISADTASYNGAIATTAEDGKAVKIDTAKYNFNSDGTAIEQGTAGGTLNLTGAVSGSATLSKVGAGTANISGSVSGFSGSVEVEAGTLNIMNIAQATSLNVADVTIGAGATMGVYNGTTATAETASEGTLTMKSGNTLKAGGANATLNANLVMEAGSTLEVSLAQATHGLTMGSTMALNTGDLLGDDDLGFVQNLKFGEYYYLYNGVDSLTVNGTQYQALNFKDWTDFDMDASVVYNTQLDEKRYALVYSWNGDNVGTIAITLIPEPTTSTLSLLALCALAARRRRKG